VATSYHSLYKKSFLTISGQQVCCTEQINNASVEGGKRSDLDLKDINASCANRNVLLK